MGMGNEDFINRARIDVKFSILERRMEPLVPVIKKGLLGYFLFQPNKKIPNQSRRPSL